MTHDVFVSHSSLDKTAADAVCHGLEAHGIRCWIAPRDEIAGQSYGEQITAAIQSAKVVVLVFSDNVNKSSAVQNEIDLAASANNPIIPFKITGDAFNSELRFYLGRVHWLDAYPLPVTHYIDNLVGMVKRNLPSPAAADEQAAKVAAVATVGATAPEASAAAKPPPDTAGSAVVPPAKGGVNTTVIAGVGAAVVIAILLAVIMMRGGAPKPAPTNAVAATASQPAAPATPPPTTVASADTAIETPAVRYFESVVVAGGPPATLDGATVINTAELLQKLQRRDQGADAFVLIDARGCTTEETIRGAVCLKPNNSGELQARVPVDMPIVAFCHDGRCPLSYEVAQSALGSGYQKVFWYRGGINAWTAAGLPTMHF